MSQGLNYSKLLVLGMVIQPLIGNPYNGYINPYYWVDDHPLPITVYGNTGSLDPIAHMSNLSAGFSIINSSSVIFMAAEY